jgi:hypothetical protein
MSDERDPLEVADFVFDFDEYTVELEEQLKKDSACFPPASGDDLSRMINDRNYFRFVYAFYVQLRGAYTPICRPGGKSECDIQSLVAEARKTASYHSEYLASRYYLRGQLIRPEWVKMVGEELAVHPDPMIARVAGQMIIKPVLEPSIHPMMSSANGGYELTLPIMVRSFLKQMGTTWANWRWATEKYGGGIEGRVLSAAAEELLQKKEKNLILLAHCWFMRDEFHPIAMPYPYFTSGSACFTHRK